MLENALRINPDDEGLYLPLTLLTFLTTDCPFASKSIIPRNTLSHSIISYSVRRTRYLLFLGEGSSRDGCYDAKHSFFCRQSRLQGWILARLERGGDLVRDGGAKLYTSEFCAFAIPAVYRAKDVNQTRQCTHHVTKTRRSIDFQESIGDEPSPMTYPVL